MALGANPPGEEPRARPEPKVKSFEISKRLIVEAWEKVRANNGAPGVDAVGIGLFQEQLRDNLYRLWNRMSSGSYFPGPVRGVEIPKDHGEGVRLLGVPNTGDRVAQTAAAMLLEQVLEPVSDLRKLAVRNGQVFRRAANLPFEGSFPIWPRNIKFFAMEYLWWKNLDVTYR